MKEYVMLTRNRFMPLFSRLFFALIFAFFSFSLYSENIEITLLYTNDIHDHIRPGYLGVGGMPYLSGFVQEVRKEKPNVLLVDSGDLLEKGDMVADYTNGEIMYQAIEKIGYQVMTLGNHDFDQDLGHLCELKQIAKSVEFVTTNFEEGLKACHKPWVVKKVGDFPIGFVGIVKLEGEEKDVAKNAIPEVKKAIEEMKQQQNCHFFIALCHLGSQTCLNISKDLPEVSIFVSAHTHELIKNAKKSTETGALVVQAGSYTQYAGYLNFVLDTETQKIIDYKDKVVELNHNKIPMDKELMDFIIAREQEVCPIASKFLIENNKIISGTQIAAISAQAMREYANADIAFCHPSLLIRSALPATKLDCNALYLTAGQRAKDLIQVTLSGKQIEQYLINLVKYHWGRTECTGMDVVYERVFPLDKVAIKTNIDLNKKYKVVMAQREFEKRLLRSLQKDNENIEEVKNTVQKCDFTFFDAVSKYIEKIREQGLTLDKYVSKKGIKGNGGKEDMEEDNDE